jgi:glycosyltransferase involved in cell wall biosynthesis
MKILFIHQNFPAQFRHIAPELARLGHVVVALGVQRTGEPLPGVQHLVHHPKAQADLLGPGAASHWQELVSKVARGESAARAMEALRGRGFVPDVVFAHPGWGEPLYVRDVFPHARLLMYGEYYYGQPGGDAGFDPEFSTDNPAMRQRTRLKNTHLLHALAEADAVLSPTHYQRSQHPAWLRDRVTVVHDGIDTARFVPDPKATVSLRAAGLTLRPGDEVLTFVARELEPYRGYHTFMRCLPHLQALRPQARVVIVGGDGASYGSPAPKGSTWKQHFLAEVAGRLDMSRVHFVGKLPHEVLTQLMQVSAAHVYLTYPFVLSWSLLEAMSTGCVIVGSDTAPLREVITHGHNGFLTDFFDPQALARQAAHALEHRREMGAIRAAARQTVVQQHDLKTHCLPAWTRFVLGDAPAPTQTTA